MYRSFYQLDKKPFQITTDPNFLWLGDKHKEALAVLKYGLIENKGFLLLTGDAGTGKTTLINALVNTLGEEIIVATLLDPGIEKDDFFLHLGKAFQLTQSFSSKGEFLHLFSKFLNRAHDQRKKVLLIIDEAQRLSQELLEEIRLLSNIEKQSSKLINIFFVGQIEFNSIILDPKNSALRQRISANYNLNPLTLKETGKYIYHRLQVAGAAKPIFNTAAIREVFRFSKGYPRLTNIICDRALVTGFIGESKKIGAKIIKECSNELKLQLQKSRPARTKNQQNTAKAAERNKPASIFRSPLIEKVLYTILALLIATWLVIAVYFYYPQYFPFHVTKNTHETVISTESEETGQVESQEPAIVQNNTESTNEQLSELSPSKNNPVVKAKPEGNPEKLEMPDPRMVIRIDFDHNNELNTHGIETLDNISRTLHNYPQLEISIKGYSKSPGSQRYNKKMSEFTANIVKGYLVGKGVSSQRIQTAGMWVLHSDSGGPATVTSRNAQWVEIQFNNP